MNTSQQKNATLHNVRLINIESPRNPPQKIECLLLPLDFQARKNTMVHMSRWFKPPKSQTWGPKPSYTAFSTQDLWGLPHVFTEMGHQLIPEISISQPNTLAVLLNWFLNWMRKWIQKNRKVYIHLKEVSGMQILNLLHQVRCLESLGSNPSAVEAVYQPFHNAWNHLGWSWLGKINSS